MAASVVKPHQYYRCLIMSSSSLSRFFVSSSSNVAALFISSPSSSSPPPSSFFLKPPRSGRRTLFTTTTNDKSMRVLVPPTSCSMSTSSVATPQEEEEKKENYGSENIQILEGLEAVRKRPGMYIGSTGFRGLYHLVYEILDNVVDEAQAGFASKVDILLLPDGSACSTDNGRGIPIDLHPGSKKSGVCEKC